MVDIQAMKAVAVAATGLAKDALHVHVGLLIFFGVWLVWRGRAATLTAWLAVLVVTLGGEWLDLRNERTTGTDVPMAAHIKDIWNTMLWPTLLALLWRWLLERGTRAASGDDTSAASGDDAKHMLE